MASKRGILALFALLAACSGNHATAVPPAPARPSLASSWTVGPIVGDKNYSLGLPLHPTALPGGGWQLDLSSGQLHYVTYHNGSLSGKHAITLTYRVDGASLVPVTAPSSQSILTLYFQRKGDNWSGAGQYEAYRWYATFASVMPIVSGEYTISAPLSGNWTAVETSSALTNPIAFNDAKNNADQVGIVFGGGTGYGHGVYATGPSTFTMLSFKVE